MSYGKEIRKSVIHVFLLLIVVEGVVGDCYQGSDGLSFDCTDKFAGEKVSIKVDVDTCRQTPKIKVHIVVAALDIDIKETFDNSREIPIPGLSAGSFAGVYLKVQIDSDDSGDVNLKLMLSVKFAISLGDITVLDQKIAKTGCNPFLYWWNSQETGVHVGVSGGGVVVLILLIVCCCKCCGCCKKDRQQQNTIIMAPQQPTANTMVVNNTNQMHAPVMYNHQPPSSNVPYKQVDRY